MVRTVRTRAVQYIPAYIYTRIYKDSVTLNVLMAVFFFAVN